MFSLHFVPFLDNLDIQTPTHDIPPESPIFLFYGEKENLSKHEILRRFKRLLDINEITFIRPYKSLTSEWIIDLQELKYSFKCFENTIYLKGILSIEPQYFQKRNFEEFSEEESVEETQIRFSIYPEDVITPYSIPFTNLNEDIKESIDRFRKDHPNSNKCGFLMMKFEDSPLQTSIVDILKAIFKNHGLKLLRADDKWYADDLFLNIKTYMHCCSFGVALFERINTNYFNPNVSLEIGYMMAMSKPLLFLKDKTLTSLQSDLISKLYYEYDFQNPEKTLESVTQKWLTDKEII